MSTFYRWFGLGVLSFLMAPILVLAQFEDPQPASEVPCTLGVAATERNNVYTVTQIGSNSTNVAYYECQLVLADYDITLGEDITLRNLPGNADYYEVLVTVLLAEDEASDDTRLYFYTEAAIAHETADELAAVLAPGAGVTAIPAQASDETEADLLPLYRQIVVLLIELLGLLQARAE